MVTVGAALIMACGAVLVYDYYTLRDSLRRDLGVLAEMTGDNSTAALSFGDRKTAGELLSGLRAKRSIVTAAIYSADGQVFASYRRDPAASAPPDALQINRNASLVSEQPPLHISAHCAPAAVDWRHLSGVGLGRRQFQTSPVRADCDSHFGRRAVARIPTFGQAPNRDLGTDRPSGAHRESRVG